MSLAYWKEAIGQALCEVGLWDSTTEDQRLELAEAMQGSADNFSTAMGYDVIPNPQDTEIDKLKARIREMERSFNDREAAMCKAAARIARVTPADVVFSDGSFKLIR